MSPAAADDICASKRDQLRHAEAGLHRDDEQGPIAAPDPGGRIGRGEQGHHLGVIEIRDRLPLVPFAGHGQYALAQERMCRLRESDIAEKRVNRGQAGIAGSTLPRVSSVVRKAPMKVGRGRQ
jgi:hypothetical protein